MHRDRIDAGRVVVIGVGNEDRGDDGVGLVVARRLSVRAPSHVRVVELGSEGSALLEVWRDADTAMVIDAMQSGAAPGTVRRFEAQEHPLPAALFHHSTHTLGVAQHIELARALRQLPKRLVVYAIEGRQYAMGRALTPAVARAAGCVVEQVVQEIGPAGSAPDAEHRHGA